MRDFHSVRGRLILAAPELAPLFGRLESTPEPGLVRPATDGLHFFYDAERLADDTSGLAAALAHCTAHCLLGHVFDRATDALSADLAATLLVEALLPDYCAARRDPLYREAKRHLAGVPLNRVAQAVAEAPFFARHREALGARIAVDSHERWQPESPALPRASGGDGWAEARLRYLNGLQGRRPGLAPGSERRRVALDTPPDRSYGALLRRYAVELEEAREDPDAFEYGLYAFGLETYGGMPLIEPSESRESRRLDELVIVIDTSGSCIESLTARFLNETRALLADDSLFARRFNLRILQCDAQVRHEVHITQLRDFERYIESLEIRGGGGTDFRPAFERIDRLVARGAFRRLPAALFFSDGLGLFPSTAPAYDAVFIFYRDHCDPIDVPPWVKRVVID